MDAQRSRRTTLPLKRGGFARDNRTGQIVKIKEWGGTDSLVTQAYKSDGFWVNRTHLTAVEDPHAWTGWTLVRFLFSLAGAFVATAGVYLDHRHHGFGVADALVYSFPLWVLAVVLLMHLFRVSRS